MKLFESAYIGQMKLKNRIIMAPMGNAIQDLASEREYFAERAKGGTGLITCGGFVTSKLEGKMGLVFESEKIFNKFELFVNEIHSYGAKVCVQLIAGSGRVGGVLPGNSGPISASEVPAFWNSRLTCRALSIEEIKFLIEAYGKAANLVKRAGADCVAFHGYGGYLTDQFMSAAWNKRTDEYGGDLDRRMKFPLDLVAEVKKTCGDDFPLIFKFTPNHLFPGGRDMEEGVEIARKLEAAGVHALQVDAGCYEVWYEAIPPVYSYKHHSAVSFAEEVKKVVNIPVFCSGKLGNPGYSEKILQEGKVDFIALGRPLLADAHWANKVKQRRIDDITPCIGCNEGCIARVFEGKNIGCAVNPLTGHEKAKAIKPGKKLKSVLVIGGGPAGLQAAITAAKEGNKVEIWEKSLKLGGNLLAAGGPDFKKDIMELVDHYRSQVGKLGISVKYLTEGTPVEIERADPDIVIIATGSTPFLPGIPGIERDNVYTAVEVLKKEKFPRQKVVVAGGGLVGVETALWLFQQGKNVVIVEMMDKILAEPLFPIDMLMIKKMLAESNITIHINTKLTEVDVDKVKVESDGKVSSIECDTLVLALGARTVNALDDELRGKVKDIVSVGDAVSPRKILNAVWEGYNAIRALAEKD